MLPLVQICIVVATLAVAAIAVAVLRTLIRFEETRSQLTRLIVEARERIVEAEALLRDTRETVVAVRETVDPIRRVAGRFEAIGERTASLTEEVLDEVGEPLVSAVSVARGVRSATAFLMERLSDRFTHGRNATNHKRGSHA